MLNKSKIGALCYGVFLLAGCTAQSDKTASDPAPNKRVASNISAAHSPSPAMLEQEKQNAAKQAQAAQQGTEQFKEYLKQNGGK